MDVKYEETSKSADDNFLSYLSILREPWDDCWGIGMLIPRPGVGYRERAIITGLEAEDVPSDKLAGRAWQPFMKLHKKTMQDLFNQLWREGFRPADGTGNSGHIEAMKYHLEDMRKLVFK